VRLDPSHVEQVLMNLVVNARDAMPRGGTLTISTDDIEADEEFAASHSGAAPGPHVRLRVRDSGTGMPPEILARVFEPFYTTKPVGKGTGLGLSTVFGIVKQSSGCIDIQSEPGRGTTVSICLPRVDHELTSAATGRAGDALTGGAETIMVVEDEDSLRALMERALRGRGYHVIVASNGEQAAAMGERVAGPIDLLLTDIVMPGMNGPDLAQWLVRRRPDMKVLFVSGFAHQMATGSGIMSSHAAFLQKPFTPDLLASTVRRVLDRSPMAGSVA
jgi:CheY-like chemotaxis protein